MSFGTPNAFALRWALQENSAVNFETKYGNGDFARDRSIAQSNVQSND
jgi:hypothetical protein